MDETNETLPTEIWAPNTISPVKWITARNVVLIRLFILLSSSDEAGLHRNIAGPYQETLGIQPKRCAYEIRHLYEFNQAILIIALVQLDAHNHPLFPGFG
jgi:hypothetical protein